jgi:hypothetical protein
MLLLVVISSVMEPMRAGFGIFLNTNTALTATSLAITGIFWIDIGLQCITTTEIGPGQVLRTIPEISRWYCRRHFLVDLTANFPIALVFDTNSASIRIFFLLALLRLTRISRAVHQIKDQTWYIFFEQWLQFRGCVAVVCCFSL